MSQDPLLQPFQLKHLTLKNRVMTTSHEPAYPEEGMPKERYRAYHVARAKGGIALTMTAGSAAVSRDSPPVFNNILVWKDEVVPWMRALADECHEHGAAVMIQLTHLGRRTRWDKADWLPAVSTDYVREPAHRAFSKKIEEWDIKRIVRDFADAAERMKAAGLDGIELQAYGHLMDQFWSPKVNRLDAPYGGDLTNRMRYTFDVLKAIRERVGDDFIVGMRCVADEDFEGGITREEGMEICRRLKASGMVDFLNIIRGHIDTDPGLTDVIPIHGMKSAPHLDFAGDVRKEIRFPVFHAARIPDVATARHAIAEGKIDMVGLTRAHMTDPHIVRKIVEGREHDIRPCVGANYCLDRIYQGGMAHCIHNASTGREHELPHEIPPAAEKKRVVVIGAGPAGLEAARVAAERGHDTTVFEAAGEPGGQIRLLAQSKRRAELIGIIDWRYAQCTRLGVQFRFNTWAEPDMVQNLAPDIVVVATGGYPKTEGLRHGDDLVISAWDILSGDVKPGREVLVFDEAGDNVGLQAAEKIADSGAEVEIMTADRSFAPEVMAMNLTPYIRALQKKNTRFTVTYRLDEVRRDGNRLEAVIGSDYGGIAETRSYDQIVVNRGVTPMDELYFDLKSASRNHGEVDYGVLVNGSGALFPKNNPEGGFDLYRIGDAVSCRNIHAAIYDALRFGVRC
ncbi:FAD-dependent oxidoreductase [Roseibium sp. RKSG952]|uniref:oxidoreductase n=1 Tax=Roseibium sp. RKSG952 TaxID=2529384 RepID=UPI0012BB6498|nr:FAD-dependent oxidoreductase [Roseibium sp. RKSG952]MTH99877.1 FAD-binding protein [Roseibium sp. RKSG952]